MSADRGKTDEFARGAVRALLAGRTESVDAAIDLAMGEQRAQRGSARPSRALLRAHAQAMEESHAGELARLLRIEATMQETLSVLSTLEETMLVHDRDAADRAAPAVYGRAVRGEFDLDPTVHIRVVSECAAHIFAEALTRAGFGEVSVGTIATRYGNLDEITFDGEHARVRITRVPPRARIDPDTDLVRGKPTEHADFEAFLGRIPRFARA